jgi:hypothetical protein
MLFLSFELCDKWILLCRIVVHRQKEMLAVKSFWSVFIILILIKNDVAETGNCIRPQVKPSPLGPIANP